MSVHIFGIRHHGPGSARSLLEAFERLGPDLILIEGPPEANDLLALAVHEQMQPPVALLVYAPEEPARALYYPYALYSPEWQAITHAVGNDIPVRFMDLPPTHRLAIEKAWEDAQAAAQHDSESATSQGGDDGGVLDDERVSNSPPLLLQQVRIDEHAAARQSI